jgi:hypothetical protein
MACGLAFKYSTVLSKSDGMLMPFRPKVNPAAARQPGLKVNAHYGNGQRRGQATC